MTDTPPMLPPADWYVDPSNAWQQRWWNGATWSEDIRPIPTQPAAPSAAAIDSAWHPVQSGEILQAQAQANFSEPYEPPPRRRGFLDSPFERPGTPRNRAGTYSLVFALFHFTLLPLVVIVVLVNVGIMPGLYSIVVLGLSFAITAVVLGILGITRARRIGGRQATAIVGLVLGLFTLLSSLGAILAVANVSLAQSMVHTNIERRATASILEHYGESVSLSCPKNLTTDEGKSYLCAGTDSHDVAFNLRVTFTDNHGTFTFKFEQAGINP